MEKEEEKGNGGLQRMQAVAFTFSSCVYVCMCVCKHVCMYVCMRVCMCACVVVAVVGVVVVVVEWEGYTCSQTHVDDTHAATKACSHLV